MRRAAVHVVVLLLRGLSEKVTEVGHPCSSLGLLGLPRGSWAFFGEGPCRGCRAHSQAASRESLKGRRCPVWTSPTKEILGKGGFVGVSL